MKLWLISQTKNLGYDKYDSAVVAAETEDDARATYPDEYQGDGWPATVGEWSCWALPEFVKAAYLGEAKPDTKAGVICASFNAG